ncbi:MAG: 3-phosphoshikimate 1-carboxyvinyltransferase [bacterium]
MRLKVDRTEDIRGEIVVPSSKSHTIRGFVFASLAEGESKLIHALEAADTQAAINACKALGAGIEKENGEFIVRGFSGKPKTDSRLDTLNSGTTTNLIMGTAALGDRKVLIDGDASIRKRTVQPLLDALNALGAKAVSLNNNGCPPVEITGRMKGGRVEVDCRSSQYISSLLINCPLALQDTEIGILNLCEQPYIEMTLRWLDELGIRYENNDFKSIRIFGNQSYKAFEKNIPGDWSSATFLLTAGVMLGRDLMLKGLDMEDTQADKQVLDYLRKMGADIRMGKEGIVVNRSMLTGCELDLNNTPDALPAISVLGCYAQGKTAIRNVAHARIKETDRIRVMTEELGRMGAHVEEKEDGMVIEHSELHCAHVHGYHDHRVVMALSLAGMIASGQTVIDTAEAVSVTFPDYADIMKRIGAKIDIIE